MTTAENTLYSRQHVAFTPDGEGFIASITGFGINAMGGELTAFVPVGKGELKTGDVFAEVESLKAAECLQVPCDCSVKWIIDGDNAGSITKDTVVARFIGQLSGDLMDSSEYLDYVNMEGL